MSSIETCPNALTAEKESRETWIVVKFALAELPEAEREVVVLHYMVGLQRREAASLLGISEVAAKKRLERAFVRLRKELPNMNEPNIKSGLPSHDDQFRSTALLLAGEFAELLASGIPILDALDQCIARAGVGPVSTAFQEMRTRVTRGEPMADAMLDHPDVFSAEDARLVLSGEEQGTLHVVLRQLGSGK
jgi:type II secretory pathway component PulF